MRFPSRFILVFIMLNRKSFFDLWELYNHTAAKRSPRHLVSLENRGSGPIAFVFCVNELF